MATPWVNKKARMAEIIQRSPLRLPPPVGGQAHGGEKDAKTQQISQTIFPCGD